MATTVLDRPDLRSPTRAIPPLPHPSWAEAPRERSKPGFSPREFWERLGL